MSAPHRLVFRLNGRRYMTRVARVPGPVIQTWQGSLSPHWRPETSPPPGLWELSERWGNTSEYVWVPAPARQLPAVTV